MRRNALLFVLISLLSGFGGTAMTLAAGIWTFDLTGSVGLAALIPVCLYGPTLVAPWLGALVDRLPRRRLVIGVDLLLGVLLLSLLTVRSAADAWLIFAVLLARGVGYVLADAGESAILPAALPPSLLGDVNGWRSSAQEGMKLLAPLLGAGLYAWRGPVPVVAVCAAMPLFSALCYALLVLSPALPGTQHRQDAARMRGVWAGVAVLVRTPAVRVPVLMAAVAISLSGITGAALIARIVHDLHLAASHLGVLSAAQGAGSIVSGLVAGRLLARSTPARMAALGAVVFAAACVLWVLPWWPALIAGSVSAGIGLPWALIAAVTAVQTATPAPLLGRVSATTNMVMFGPVAVAVPLGSALIEIGPARAPLAAAAVLAAIAAAFSLRPAHPPGRLPTAPDTERDPEPSAAS